MRPTLLDEAAKKGVLMAELVIEIMEDYLEQKVKPPVKPRGLLRYDIQLCRLYCICCDETPRY